MKPAQDADWTDEALWHQVMPALGDFCSLEFIREECKKAKEIPAYENTFRQLYLNQWTEQASAGYRWSAGRNAGALTLLTLADRECYAGLDLGVTGDMSALALVFPNDDGGFDVTARFWVPEDGRWKSEQRNHELYREWHRRGLLTFTPGEATDFDQVEHDILGMHDQYPFIALFADRAYASHLLSRLFNNHGLNVKGITQGPVTLNEPMVKLEVDDPRPQDQARWQPDPGLERLQRQRSPRTDGLDVPGQVQDHEPDRRPGRSHRRHRRGDGQ